MNNNFNQGYTIKSGQQNFTGDIRQYHSGSGDNVAGNKVMNNYDSSLSSSLTQAVEEINNLLEDLDKAYSSPVMVIAKAIEAIDSNSTLKRKFVNALKLAGIDAFRQQINHPSAEIIIAAGKEFIKAEK